MLEQNKKKILIVDDEVDLLEIAYDQITLNFQNIAISMVKSGNDAISLIKEGQEFDLIISDYNMPDGNGTELLKFITSENYPSFFILYTSHLKPELPELKNERFLGVIEKFKFDELFEGINKSFLKSYDSCKT